MYRITPPGSTAAELLVRRSGDGGILYGDPLIGSNNKFLGDVNASVWGGAQSTNGMVQLPEDLMPEPLQGFSGRSLGSSGFPSVDGLPSNGALTLLMLFCSIQTAAPKGCLTELH